MILLTESQDERPCHNLCGRGVLVEISAIESFLFDRNRLGEVSGLVDVASFVDGDVVSQQLQRNGYDDRHQTVGDDRNFDDVIGPFANLFVFASDHSDDFAAAAFAPQ